jgi:hypothetical protein
MKKSDLIAKLSSELEVELRRAADKLEAYSGDKLEVETIVDAGLSALEAASDISSSDDIDAVIGALQSIGE